MVGYWSLEGSGRTRRYKRGLFENHWLIECSGTKLHKAQEIMLSAEVTRPDQTITCSVMCDDIGEIGSLRILFLLEP